jgi:type I restriction enzyme S subunit
MGRGRKPISNFNGSDWETVFYNSVGTYVQYINIQLSKEYALEPLSNHLKIVGGYAFKTAEYKNQGIPIIRISDFNNEQLVLKDVVYYQEAKELYKYQLIEGDIIIALTGGTIAKLAIVQAGLGKIYLNQRVGKFQTLNPDEFEVEYIYWLARSIQSIIKNLAWGAAIPNVSPKQIEELKFPFPPKEIQRGIIDFLNDLKNNNLKENKIYFDEIIENKIILLQERQLTTSTISTELTHQFTLVKKLRQQLLQDAVQGKVVEQNNNDEPASDLLRKIKAEKEKLIAEKKLKKEKELKPIKPEEIPFEIPENWVWCRLGTILNPERGLSYGVVKPSINDPNGVVFIKSGDIGEFVVNENINTRITIELDNEYKRTKIKGGEILITLVGASIGRCSIVPNSLIGANVSRAVGVCNIVHSISKHYFLYQLYCSIQTLISRNLLDGSNRPVLNLDTLRNIAFALPPLSEQNRIVQKLDELMQYCNELEASIKQSEVQNEKLRQQVLREALRKDSILENDLILI